MRGVCVCRTVHCLIRARLASRPKSDVFGASAMDERVAFGASGAVARNAKYLVAFNSRDGMRWLEFVMMQSQPFCHHKKSLHQQFSMARKDFFSVVRMEGKFQGGYDRFWEKNLLLYAFTHKHTSGWFASHRKFSLPRIIPGLCELRCSLVTLGLCHLRNRWRLPSAFSEWHWIFPSECSSFADFFGFFLREFPVFSCLVRCDCAGMKIQGPTEKFLLRVFIHKFRAFPLAFAPRSPFFVLGTGPRFSTWFSPVIQSADRNCARQTASHFCHPPMQTFWSAKNSRESIFWEPHRIAS